MGSAGQMMRPEVPATLSHFQIDTTSPPLSEPGARRAKAPLIGAGGGSLLPRRIKLTDRAAGADMKPAMSILALVEKHGLQGHRPVDPGAVAALRDALGGSTFGLVKDWWHADDLETSLELLREGLASHGLAGALPEAALQSDHARLWEDYEACPRVGRVPQDLVEALARRRQIAVVAVYANRELGVRGDERRFRCFGSGLVWERGEPPWLLVTESEHRELLRIGGPPARFEAPYDAVSSPEAIPARCDFTLDASELAPFEARRFADEAMRDNRPADALAFFPRAVLDGDHGLLAELHWIDALRRLGRRDEAKTRWTLTAEDWLSGKRRVWDTQWFELDKLGKKLDLGESEIGARIRAKSART